MADPLTSDSAIEGVRIVPLRRIPDERGTIFHMLRRDDPHFLEFGEIYFTSIYRDVIKGWHRHADMTLNYACPWGRVKLVLYDDRDGSANARRPDGALPGARRLLAGRHPAARLERHEGHGGGLTGRKLRHAPA